MAEPDEKKTWVVVLLALLGGALIPVGAHRFYLGKPASGVVYLLFCWTLIPQIVSLFEAVLIPASRAASGKTPSPTP